MLVGQYPIYKRFEKLLGYLPELSLESKKIDKYLEDEKLYKLIRRPSEAVSEDKGDRAELNTCGGGVADTGG